MTTNDWVAVCRTDEVPRAGARRVTRDAGPEVAVFRTDADEFFALLDSCPHRQGPLSQGIVFGRAVACPLHNWAIGLEDGCARAPDEGRTPRFRLRIAEGQVWLDAQELDTLGTHIARPAAGPGCRGTQACLHP